MTGKQNTLKQRVDRSVAVDLDGVLAHYCGWTTLDKIGSPLPGAREFLQALRDRGHWIVIHSGRINKFASESNDIAFNTVLAAVAEWLIDNEMPYDEIWSSSGKPLAVAYVDDRALQCQSQRNKGAFKQTLLDLEKLEGTHKAGG